MSSSKVFKQDASFTPINLIQEELEEPSQSSHSPFEEEGLEPQESIAENQKEQVEIKQPEEPKPKTPPPPEIDVEAVREEAYTQGVNDATNQLHNDLDTIFSAFKTSSEQLDKLYPSLLDKYRGDIINIIIALSKKIIGKELSTGRSIIAATVETALDLALNNEEFVITLHPDDIEAVEQLRPELLNQIRSLQHIALRTDQNLERGGCLLESKECKVDATIETQLESARELLEENVESLGPAEMSEDEHATSPPNIK